MRAIGGKISLGLAAALLLAVLLPAGDARGAGDVHQGVASCAGSTCHGATRPLGTHGIRQDEYFVWQQRDPHSRAHLALTGADGQRIGARLRIDAARATECLACHADAATPEQRGERWLASDGIGCETCHGGAGRWLAEHARPGLDAARKVALGMTPIWQPQERAALCLGCHQGDAAHPITHAMMAAGHPPLLFELDSFTALQPAHFERDADYAARKGDADPARTWALGQAMAADRLLENLVQGGAVHGLFPELALFDCDACHHPLTAGRWQSGRNAGTAPGTPPLADAPLYWVALWLEVTAPELSAGWQRGVGALQATTGTGPAQLREAAKALRQTLREQVLPQMNAQALDRAHLRALLLRLAAIDGSTRSHDFLLAEQSAMAAQVLSDALARAGQPAGAARRRAIDALYRSVQHREAFDLAGYHAGLQELRRSLR